MTPSHARAPASTRALTRRGLAKQQTQAKVLAAARALFEDRGYERTVIRDIAAAAGISTGAVFANFVDKADLYREIFGRAPISPEQGAALDQALGRLVELIDSEAVATQLAFLDVDLWAEVGRTIQQARALLPQKVAGHG